MEIILGDHPLSDEKFIGRNTGCLGEDGSLPEGFGCMPVVAEKSDLDRQRC